MGSREARTRSGRGCVHSGRARRGSCRARRFPRVRAKGCRRERGRGGRSPRPRPPRRPCGVPRPVRSPGRRMRARGGRQGQGRDGFGSAWCPWVVGRRGSRGAFPARPAVRPDRGCQVGHDAEADDGGKVDRELGGGSPRPERPPPCRPLDLPAPPAARLGSPSRRVSSPGWPGSSPRAGALSASAWQAPLPRPPPCSPSSPSRTPRRGCSSRAR